MGWIETRAGCTAYLARLCCCMNQRVTTMKMEGAQLKIPFWEDSYKDDSVSTFGTQPNGTIDEFQHLFNKSWSVLDVGCGDGKNSLYLSDLGYTEVEAFDISESAIAKLNRLAVSKNLSVTAWTQDLTKFAFRKRYDLIMSFGTLHFVEKEYWRKFILDAKENTNDHGIHIIQLFTMCCRRHPTSHLLQ